MKKQTAIFFYVLGAYVVLQFLWWGYHLIDLSEALGESDSESRRRIFMIIGEGSVFFLILIFGLIKIRSSIKKELALSQRQSNFLLSVTHELKTPLTSNKLYLQTLLKRSNLPEDKKVELLQSALSENERLQDMIDNILTASQLDNKVLALNAVKEDLKPFLADLVRKWSYQRCDISFYVDTSRDVKIDKVLLEIILTNLFENSLKYAEGKGLELLAVLKENRLELVVKDTGPGIPKSKRSKVFQKFYRAGEEETRSQKGTGLGLYIVSELVQIHNGEITFEPNIPSGSQFKIILQNV